MNRWTPPIDDITAAFEQHFAGLRADQLNWKPAASAWSIAQNIDHLITINSTYFPVIEAVRRGNYSLPWTGQIPFLVKFFGKAILQGVQPEQGRKSKTFPIWEPSTSALPADILQTFRTHQESLKRTIVQADDLLQLGTVISSPAKRIIVYKLETAFDIIVAHERRHLQQALQVKPLIPA